MSQTTNPDQPLYLDPARPIAERVKDLITRLTLDEKVGLMSHFRDPRWGRGQETWIVFHWLLPIA